MFYYQKLTVGVKKPNHATPVALRKLEGSLEYESAADGACGGVGGGRNAFANIQGLRRTRAPRGRRNPYIDLIYGGVSQNIIA